MLYARDPLPIVGTAMPGTGPKTHAGLPVSGYKPQSAEKVALVNSFKEAEERLLRSIDMALRLDDPSKENPLGRLLDGRWAATARTHFEQGFMALNRAVFQPGRVTLPEDAQQPDPTFKNEVLNDVDA